MEGSLTAKGGVTGTAQNSWTVLETVFSSCAYLAMEFTFFFLAYIQQLPNLIYFSLKGGLLVAGLLNLLYPEVMAAPIGI